LTGEKSKNKTNVAFGSASQAQGPEKPKEKRKDVDQKKIDRSKGLPTVQSKASTSTSVKPLFNHSGSKTGAAAGTSAAPLDSNKEDSKTTTSANSSITLPKMSERTAASSSSTFNPASLGPDAFALPISILDAENEQRFIQPCSPDRLAEIKEVLAKVYAHYSKDKINKIDRLLQKYSVSQSFINPIHIYI
jgi:hypothetical protein